MSEDKENGTQRWTAKRRVALVLTILRGETTSQEAARQHGLTVAEIEDWKEKFLSGAENALRSKPRDEEAQREEREKRLKAKIGDLVLELDILKEAVKGRPFVPPTSDE
jgi:transposase-like protein